MIDISIIIVNYNVKRYIIPCIESIYNNKPIDYSFEFIIVDNNSKDGSVENIKEKFPNVTLIENKKNIGFACAVNQGVKQADGNNLFILNPDTLFVEDSLSKLLLFSYKKNNRAVIGPSLIYKSGKIQQSFWEKPTLINTINSIFHMDFFNYKKNYKNKRLDSNFEVDSVSGGAIFTTSETFKLLNGFNENLFWMEDIDYCVRAKKLQNKIFYFPETKIIHYQGKSSQHNLKIAISNQLLSKIKFFDIHYSHTATIILKVAIFFLSILKSTLFLILSPFKPIYKNKMLGYFIVMRSILFDS